MVFFWLMYIRVYIIMYWIYYKFNYKWGVIVFCDGMCIFKIIDVYIFDYRCWKINNDDIFIVFEI